MQKSDLKKPQSAPYNHEKEYFSGSKQANACLEAKCEQETQNDTQSQKQEKNQTDNSPRINLSYTHNIFEVGTSSMLVDQGFKPNSVFGGDRFIPMRSFDTHLEGPQKFRHEENLLAQL